MNISLLSEVASENLITPMELDLYALSSYDAIWALAAAISRSMHDDDKLPGGAQVMANIREGRIPGFRGAKAWHQWNAAGDVDIDKAVIKFTSYSRRPGSSEATVDIVGYWTQSAGVELVVGTPIIWRDGTTYPTASVPLKPFTHLRHSLQGFK